MSPAHPNADTIQKEAKEWIVNFISYPGHANQQVTPYMHVFAYHVPDQIRENGNIRQFSGQGVEKNNDDAKGSSLLL